jgi:hypothetical protein
MATITLRAVKGSPLTNNEVDANFSNLNNDKLESSAYTASDVLTKIKTVDGSGSGLDADLLDGLNSATANTVSTIVARDSSGNFAAGTITAALTGNASTATTLQTSRAINGVSFNGSADITVTTAGTGITVTGTQVAIDSTVATLTGSQTLTNKTLTSPTINTGTLNNGILTGSLTAGGSTGTSGYLLQSTGTGVQWASATISLAAGSGSGSVSTGGTLTISGTTNRITTSASGSEYTLTTPQDLHTSANFQVNSIGVGTAASGTTGEIRATNNITAFYSDERLKENIKPIENALEKVMTLRGVTYNSNSIAESFGYKDKSEQVGVIAQDVEKVLPHVVKAAPFDIIQLSEGIEISRSGQNYKTVQYERIIPLLIEAIKELNKQVEQLKNSKE